MVPSVSASMHWAMHVRVLRSQHAPLQLHHLSEQGLSFFALLLLMEAERQVVGGSPCSRLSMLRSSSSTSRAQPSGCMRALAAGAHGQAAHGTDRVHMGPTQPLPPQPQRLAVVACSQWVVALREGAIALRMVHRAARRMHAGVLHGVLRARAQMGSHVLQHRRRTKRGRLVANHHPHLILPIP
jgi:hypothetical protein